MLVVWDTIYSRTRFYSTLGLVPNSLHPSHKMHVFREALCPLEQGLSRHWDSCLIPCNYHTHVWIHRSLPSLGSSYMGHTQNITCSSLRGHTSRSQIKSHSIVIVAQGSHSLSLLIIQKYIIKHIETIKFITQYLDKN